MIGLRLPKRASKNILFCPYPNIYWHKKSNASKKIQTREARKLISNCVCVKREKRYISPTKWTGCSCFKAYKPLKAWKYKRRNTTIQHVSLAPLYARSSFEHRKRCEGKNTIHTPPRTWVSVDSFITTPVQHSANTKKNMHALQNTRQVRVGVHTCIRYRIQRLQTVLKYYKGTMGMILFESLTQYVFRLSPLCMYLNQNL